MVVAPAEVAVAAGDGVAEVAVVLVKNLAAAGRALALAQPQVRVIFRVMAPVLVRATTQAMARVQVPVALVHQIEAHADENARPMACSSGKNKHWY